MIRGEKSAVNSIKNAYLHKKDLLIGSYQLQFKHYYQLSFENHMQGQTNN